MGQFFRKLITADTGVSSKAFFLVVVTIIGSLLLFVCGFVMVWEVVARDTISTDLSGIAQIILAVASVFTSAGLTKAASEFNKNRKSQDDDS